MFVAKIELLNCNDAVLHTVFHKGSSDRQRLRADLLDACIKIQPTGWQSFGGDATNRYLAVPDSGWTYKASLGDLQLI